MLVKELPEETNLKAIKVELPDVVHQLYIDYCMHPGPVEKQVWLVGSMMGDWWVSPDAPGQPGSRRLYPMPMGIYPSDIMDWEVVEVWKLLKDDKAPRSSNYKKQCNKIAKIHKHISDHRLDGLHKLTTYLAKNHSEVVIENLNVSGMLKNHNLSKHIANGSFYEFRRQLEYKGLWYGCKITVVDRFFPSSKLCSHCGHINQNLKLSDREWDCDICNTHHQRDNTASVNLEQYPVKHAHKYEKKEKQDKQPIGGYAASSAVKDCGAWSSVAEMLHSPAVKQ